MTQSRLQYRRRSNQFICAVLYRDNKIAATIFDPIVAGILEAGCDFVESVGDFHEAPARDSDCKSSS